jgi:hypothetical protein
MRPGIALRGGLLAVLAVAAPTGSACDGSSAPASVADAPTDVHAQIYRLHFSDGAIVLTRVGLDGGTPVQLAKHRIEGEAEEFQVVASSQDRRQVLFGFDAGKGLGQQVLLFQATGGRERKLLSLPRGTLLAANFSPDGLQLALYAKEVGVAKAPRMGLYLVDTSSGKWRYLGAPDVAEQDAPYGFDPRWSPDGQWLFLAATVAYRVDLDQGRFEPARRLQTGPMSSCTGEPYDVDFQGRRISTLPAVKPQSEVSCQKLASPDGAIASFDADAVLWVESADQRLRVLQAPHDRPVLDAAGNRIPVPCGHSYGIQGWQGGRILFYRLDSSSYAYDLQRQVSFDLPGGLEEGDRFWW